VSGNDFGFGIQAILALDLRVGIPRLRGWFAKRTILFARDDNDGKSGFLTRASRAFGMTPSAEAILWR
jgi:hypothetical protein